MPVSINVKNVVQVALPVPMPTLVSLATPENSEPSKTVFVFVKMDTLNLSTKTTPENANHAPTSVRLVYRVPPNVLHATQQSTESKVMTV